MRTGPLWLIATLLPFLVLAGCSPHSCLTGDCGHVAPETCLDNACHDTAPSESAAIEAQTVSTVLNPEGTKRYISLQECIARALECGRVGGTNIRVLAYDPAIAYTAIEEGLSRFDARWTSSMTWSAIDEPVGNTFVGVPLGFQALQGANGVPVGGPSAVTAVPNQNQAINGILNNVVSTEAATLQTTIEKTLPTGGLAGITFRTDYTLVNQPQQFSGQPNPTYTPRLIFSIDQPLLKGFGTTINHNPILITRLNFDQAREQFAGSVDQLLFAVEQAYWDLYFAYWNLHTQDTGLRQAHEAWQIAKQLKDQKLVTVQDLAALELQYQTFRLARLDALGGPGRSVLEAERQLRFVVGLPSEDGHRLIPTDTPTTAPYQPDWHASVAAAMESRPDLTLVRNEIKKIQLDIKKAKDSARPDLRAIATYDINGLGTRLDGATAGEGNGSNALRSLASDHFNDWTVGLTLDVPIGFRAAHAQIRRGELQLAQRMTQLRDLEKQVGFALQQSYRELLQAGEVLRIQASIRKAATDRYRALYDQFRAGLEGPNFLLIAQQNWTTAMAAERGSVFAYNIALAKFELAKGTIQGYDNVSISDGPLPAGVQERASAHINERQRAHVLRERPGPVHLGSPSVGDDGHTEMAPVVGAADGPPSIPALPLDQTLSAGGPERLATETPTVAAPPPSNTP